MKFKSDIEVQAGIKDSAGNPGTTGQVLSSNGTTVSWIDGDSDTANTVLNQVKAGVAINKGQAVYVTSADGTNIIVGLASNTSEATSSKTLGLLDATVATNDFANVVQIGRLAGLNTIGATVGDPVWLGQNGNLIYGLSNKPYAPLHLVFIGVVTRVNANNGEIFINVQNGFELKEIHDVDLVSTTPTNNNILAFEGGSVNLWKNKSLGTILGGTDSQFVKGDGSLDSTTYVTVSTDQSITGLKTFTETAKFDLNINLSKTGTFSVPSLYNTIGAYNTEFKFGIDSSRIAIVDLANLTAPRIYNYPDKDGIFAMTSDLHSAVTIGTANGLSLSGQELSLGLSSATTTGALSSTDWSTFNNKQNALNGTGFVKISGTTISYDNSTYTPTSRTLTINGTSYDLSANRSWTIPTHDAVTIGTANGLSLSGQALSLGLSSASTNGALSSTDWTTFNGKLGGNFSTDGQIPVSTGSNNSFTSSQLKEVSSSLHIGTISDANPYDSIIFSTKILPSFGQFRFKNVNTTTYGAGTAIDLEGTYTTSFPTATTAFARILAKKSNTTNGNWDGDLLFYTRQNSESSVFSNAAAMIIKTSGNVGIGTTSPSQKLVVDGGSSDYTPIWAKSSFLSSSKYYASLYTGYALSSNQASQFGYVYDTVTPTNSFAHITPYGSTEGSKFMVRADGNVGIGTTSPGALLDVNGSIYSRSGSILSNNFGGYSGSDVNFTTNTSGGANLIFKTSLNERMRIDSAGDVFIGKSAIDYTVTGVQIENGGKAFGITTNTSTSTMFLNRRNSLTGSFIGFYYNDGLVGSISTNGTTTSYNITSDYRVKEDFKSINGLDLISKIKIYDFKFKNSDFRMSGVIAHELQEVIPYAVTGEKDAEQMQSVDYSKLVPILVQAIQELKAEIEILKNK